MKPDEKLTLQQLADAIGPQRNGRPTSAETVRGWCLRGIDGVLLKSYRTTYRRTTTWGDYQRFLERVEYVRVETRRKRKEFVKSMGIREQRKRRKRAEEARRKLEAMNAR